VNKGAGLDRYRDDPVGFCRHVLGFEPWEGQRAVLNELAASDAVTVPAGRAVGKSRLDGGAALWFACTRPGSRVILTAPTFKQVQQILWEEIRNLAFAASQRGAPLPIDVAKMASTGARTNTNSQILGITAEKPEAFQGIRGAEMLLIADEASGINDDIFHVIDGNTAGGAKLLLTGNPTKARGYFRESMRSPRFRCLRLSSEESPNVREGRIVIRGLATQDWIEERRREWGEDSALYRIHVKGEVVEAEEGQLFPLELIEAAKARWGETKASGRLVIGVDPAGSGQDGDESAFACRRGQKITKLHARRGLTEEGILTEILGLIATQRGDSFDVPLVVVDKAGDLGARVHGTLRAYQLQHDGVFRLVGIRGGEKATRKPLVYDRVRDEVWYSLVDSFRNGLAIPEDVKLERELSVVKGEAHISGRSKVTSKDEFREVLDGRSPDRADALALACWETGEWKVKPHEAPPRPTYHDPYREPVNRGMDPYAAMDAWEPSGLR
jgi:phage terminase large subunit